MRLVSDACHTWNQVGHDGHWVPADLIHRANLATLHTEFARVVDSADLLSWSQLRLAS